MITEQKKGKKKKSAREIIDRELLRIRMKHGLLTPELILEAAESPKSPLHSHFEWNNSIAGRKYRIEQAYAMLQASKIIPFLAESKKSAPVAEPVRAYLPWQYGEGKFKTRKEVLDESAVRQEFIDRKLEVLRSWCRETVDIGELKDLRSVILKHPLMKGN